MRDRIRIAKTAPQEWTVTQPRIGFSGPEITTWTRWADAMGHVNLLLARLRWGSTDTGVDRAHSVTDCLNPISPWTPLWFPGNTNQTRRS